VTDDRYTVEDPPGDRGWVWCADICLGEIEPYQTMYRTNAECKKALEAGAVHRTPESAEAHARRMLMADDILQALEMLLRAQGSESPKWREHVTRGARAVAKKARGEVAP
jgi:hypothetical protein